MHCRSRQIYKQLLMLSGFDRYIQLARCFRDEDLRADRQPEFTQVDLEMSFVTQEDIMDMLEGYIQRLYREIKGIEIGKMPRLTYREAMERYGSDKPDTRFEMEIINLSEQVREPPSLFLPMRWQTAVRSAASLRRMQPLP